MKNLTKTEKILITIIAIVVIAALVLLSGVVDNEVASFLLNSK